MKSLSIIQLINKEPKSGLHYCLRAINHKAWFYTFEEFYTKQELRDALKGELFNIDGSLNLSNINKLDNFKKAIQ